MDNYYHSEASNHLYPIVQQDSSTMLDSQYAMARNPNESTHVKQLISSDTMETEVHRRFERLSFPMSHSSSCEHDKNIIFKELHHLNYYENMFFNTKKGSHAYANMKNIKKEYIKQNIWDEFLIGPIHQKDFNSEYQEDAYQHKNGETYVISSGNNINDTRGFSQKMENLSFCPEFLCAVEMSRKEKNPITLDNSLTNVIFLENAASMQIRNDKFSGKNKLQDVYKALQLIPKKGNREKKVAECFSKMENTNFIFMKAPDFSKKDPQYTVDILKKILKQIRTGFLYNNEVTAKSTSGSAVKATIHTCAFGCGYAKNSEVIIILLQMLAAQKINMNLIFHDCNTSSYHLAKKLMAKYVKRQFSIDDILKNLEKHQQKLSHQNNIQQLDIATLFESEKSASSEAFGNIAQELSHGQSDKKVHIKNAKGDQVFSYTPAKPSFSVLDVLATGDTLTDNLSEKMQLMRCGDWFIRDFNQIKNDTEHADDKICANFKKIAEYMQTELKQKTITSEEYAIINEEVLHNGGVVFKSEAKHKQCIYNALLKHHEQGIKDSPNASCIKMGFVSDIQTQDFLTQKIPSGIHTINLFKEWYQPEGKQGAVLVVYGNEFLGGGALGRGAVQEEMVMLKSGWFLKLLAWWELKNKTVERLAGPQEAFFANDIPHLIFEEFFYGREGLEKIEKMITQKQNIVKGRCKSHVMFIHSPDMKKAKNKEKYFTRQYTKVVLTDLLVRGFIAYVAPKLHVIMNNTGADNTLEALDKLHINTGLLGCGDFRNCELYMHMMQIIWQRLAGIETNFYGMNDRSKALFNIALILVETFVEQGRPLGDIITFMTDHQDDLYIERYFVGNNTSKPNCYWNEREKDITTDEKNRRIDHNLNKMKMYLKTLFANINI